RAGRGFRAGRRALPDDVLEGQFALLAFAGEGAVRDDAAEILTRDNDLAAFALGGAGFLGLVVPAVAGQAALEKVDVEVAVAASDQLHANLVPCAGADVFALDLEIRSGVLFTGKCEVVVFLGRVLLLLCARVALTQYSQGRQSQRGNQQPSVF